MAEIKTRITMVDALSGSVNKMCASINKMVDSLSMAEKNINKCSLTTKKAATESAIATESSASRQAAALNKVEHTHHSAGEAMRQATAKQSGLTTEFTRSSDAASNLLKKVLSIVSAYGGIKGAKFIMDSSDTYVSNTARLGLITNSMEEQRQLQEEIYQSALRSRGVYNDIVDVNAKLGLLAADNFKDNTELVRFVELMNKSFLVGGADAQEQAAAMYQLTQAMASGRLQGDEFRTVRESAPMLVQSISKYTGKDMAELKAMSADGAITADIIKNSMFLAAENIEEKYKTLPKTFGDVWNEIKTTAQYESSNLLKRINNALNSDNVIDGIIAKTEKLIKLSSSAGNFIIENWSNIEKAIVVTTSAIATHMFVQSAANAQRIISAAATTLQCIASKEYCIALAMESGMTEADALAQWQLLRAKSALTVSSIALAGAVAIVAAGFMYLRDKMGSTQNAITALQLSAKKFVTTSCLAIHEGVIFWQNGCSNIHIFWVKTTTAMGNAMDTFKLRALNSIKSLVSTVFGVLQDFASKIDSAFGTNLISALTSAGNNAINSKLDKAITDTQASINNRPAATLKISEIESAKQQRIDTYNALKRQLNSDIASQENALIKAVVSSNNSKWDGANKGLDVVASGVNDAAGYTKDADSHISNIANAVDIASEDLRYLRDIAEQEVVNQIQTRVIVPNTTISFGDVRESADVNQIVGRIQSIINEELNIGADGLALT